MLTERALDADLASTPEIDVGANHTEFGDIARKPRGGERHSGEAPRPGRDQERPLRDECEGRPLEGQGSGYPLDGFHPDVSRKLRRPLAHLRAFAHGQRTRTRARQIRGRGQPTTSRSHPSAEHLVERHQVRLLGEADADGGALRAEERLLGEEDRQVGVDPPLVTRV